MSRFRSNPTLVAVKVAGVALSLGALYLLFVHMTLRVSVVRDNAAASARVRDGQGGAGRRPRPAWASRRGDRKRGEGARGFSPRRGRILCGQAHQLIAFIDRIDTTVGRLVIVDNRCGGRPAHVSARVLTPCAVIPVIVVLQCVAR